MRKVVFEYKGNLILSYVKMQKFLFISNIVLYRVMYEYMAIKYMPKSSLYIKDFCFFFCGNISPIEGKHGE